MERPRGERLKMETDRRDQRGYEGRGWEYNGEAEWGVAENGEAEWGVAGNVEAERGEAENVEAERGV